MTQQSFAVASAVERMKLRRKLAERSDRYYSQAEPLAQELIDLRIRAAQVRTLENVAYSTEKVSDILNFVKTRIGRDRRWGEVGETLLSTLARLRGDADAIAREVGGEDADLPRRIHLKLCREFLKHVAAQFVYRVGAETAGDDDADRG